MFKLFANISRQHNTPLVGNGLIFLFYLLNSIDKRRKEVMDRRQKVKDQAAERHNALLGSQAFQEFKRDAAEVR